MGFRVSGYEKATMGSRLVVSAKDVFQQLPSSRNYDANMEPPFDKFGLTMILSPKP